MIEKFALRWVPDYKEFYCEPILVITCCAVMNYKIGNMKYFTIYYPFSFLINLAGEPYPERFFKIWGIHLVAINFRIFFFNSCYYLSAFVKGRRYQFGVYFCVCSMITRSRCVRFRLLMSRIQNDQLTFCSTRFLAFSGFWYGRF